MDDVVKVLLVHTGTDPIKLDRIDVPANDTDKLREVILNHLNSSGKQAHALLRCGDEYRVATHTARKGPSKDYFTHRVTYHRFLSHLHN